MENNWRTECAGGEGQGKSLFFSMLSDNSKEAQLGTGP